MTQVTPVKPLPPPADGAPAFRYDFKTQGMPALASGCPWYNEPVVPFAQFKAFTCGYANGVALPQPGVPLWQREGAWPAWSAFLDGLEAQVMPNADACAAAKKLLSYFEPIRCTSGQLSLVAAELEPPIRRMLPPDLATAKTQYVGGSISTWPCAQVGGRWEWIGQIAKGKGLWNAYWLLGQKAEDKSEIDFEILGGMPTVVHCSLHFGAARPGMTQAIDVGVDLSLTMHRYTVIQLPEAVEFYLDDRLICTLTAPKFNTPLTMISTLAVGQPGSWPGAPDATVKFPVAAHVQCMTVWPK